MVLAACFLAGVLSAAHAAAPNDSVPSIVVNYSDLNLSTEVGTLALYRRIVAAARQVCPSADTRELQALALSRACQAAATERAVHDVNSPKLAAAYEARSRRG
jgi:UrcA family protein